MSLPNESILWIGQCLYTHMVNGKIQKRCNTAPRLSFIIKLEYRISLWCALCFKYLILSLSLPPFIFHSPRYKWIVKWSGWLIIYSHIIGTFRVNKVNTFESTFTPRSRSNQERSKNETTYQTIIEIGPDEETTSVMFKHSWILIFKCAGVGDILLKVFFSDQI